MVGPYLLHVVPDNVPPDNVPPDNVPPDNVPPDNVPLQNTTERGMAPLATTGERIVDDIKSIMLGFLSIGVGSILFINTFNDIIDRQNHNVADFVFQRQDNNFMARWNNFYNIITSRDHNVGVPLNNVIDTMGGDSVCAGAAFFISAIGFTNSVASAYDLVLLALEQLRRAPND